MVYPWQTAAWQGLAERWERLPHALLLAGPAGGGKSGFALALAQGLLCEDARGSGGACGNCPSCRWFAGGNHPDFRLVTPGSDEAEPAEEDAEAGKRSTQIRIEQIRALTEFLTVGAVRQGRRVVLLQPAEAMNNPTANALLKLLEEPPPSTQFILVSDRPRLLLPTIRSRCQQLAFPRPERAAALGWLAGEGVAEAETLLDFAGGMPVSARALAAGPLAEARRRFLGDILALKPADAVGLAGRWEAWLKGAAKVEGSVDLPTLAGWMQKWLADLVAVGLAGRPRFFPDQASALAQRAARAPVPALLACYNEFLQIRRAAQHPLNVRLFLDDMILRYARLTGRDTP